MNFKEELQNRQAYVEELLQQYQPQAAGFQKTVIEAMNYSLLSGGKRLRPILMLETYRLFSKNKAYKKENICEPFMAAIEMIHTYSLVHDDLPAMDNDEYRRGRKTTHVVFGEDMAILAGDGLLNYAFETAMKAFTMRDASMEEETERIIKALTVLGQKAGIFGMIGGQTADVEAENLNQEMTQEQILFIHEHKTAALIQAALMIGAILAGADEKQVHIMEQIGYNVGVAFQIQDDILDVISTTEVLGKPVHSDEKNHKTTYVTLKGIEQADREQKDMSVEALVMLESFQWQNTFLYELVKNLTTREK